MKKNKKAANACFLIAFFAIVAMFMTANAFKGSSWTAISWIIVHFWYGYFAFILGAIIFTTVGILMMREKKIDWSWFSRHPKVLKALIIALFIVVLLLLLKACGALFDELGIGGNDSDVCGICGGSGVFQGKRCWCVGR